MPRPYIFFSVGARVALTAAATEYRLPERYTPKNWKMNKFSMEIWLQHALRTHAWRSESAAAADVILVEANFSMACRAGKMFTGRFMWQKMNMALGVPSKGKQTPGAPSPPPVTLHPSLRGAEHVPRAFVLTDNECQPPWTGTRKAKGMIELTDHNPNHNDIVAPFVLARPWWLVGGKSTPSDPPPPAVVPWAERRLLFFAGHVPKLYIRPTRYQIWQQIRRHPGVTALSATLNCTVGSFSVCKEAALANFSVERSRVYCHDFCASHVMDDYKTLLNDAPGHARRNLSEGGPARPSAKSRAGRCVNGPLTLRRNCRAYRSIAFTPELLGDMAKSAVNLPSARYFENAFSHKFCLAAPGAALGLDRTTYLGGVGGVSAPSACSVCHADSPCLPLPQSSHDRAPYYIPQATSSRRRRSPSTSRWARRAAACQSWFCGAVRSVRSLTRAGSTGARLPTSSPTLPLGAT